jgi:phenylalanyl-tRNA synthetase beta chain
VNVPDGPPDVASALAKRGFEVASIEEGRQPVVDFEITANRPDCLSVMGLAREASAAYGLPLKAPDRSMPPAGQPQPIDVVIEDAERCPRYCAQVFEVRSTGHTPDWMRDRLEACGLRSISPIVDVTNYVMLEMGQPTHAFDYAKLAGRALRIRRARAGETIRTLDGVERVLDPEMLVIADAERPQAVGGVMGGALSEIGAGTRLMVLESAYFKPASVRRTSKRLALKTEASTRFERGADVDGAPAAIERAAVLLQQIGAAQPLGPTIDRYPSPRRPLVLSLRASRIAGVLGVIVPDADVPARLEPLGFAVATGEKREAGRENPGSGIDALRASHLATCWTVTVPTFRVDVQREIDLIEEVARHDGYASLPATFPRLTAAQPQPDPRTVRDRRLRQLLTACGFSEAMTFAFIEAHAAGPFAENVDRLVAVANPLSEKFAVLRPSLLPGLVESAAHNRRRQHHDVRLFETGARFAADGESRAVAAVWAGAGLPAHWSGPARPADFYDVKGVVEVLAAAFGLETWFGPAEIPYLVPGTSAVVAFRLKASAAARAEIHAGSGETSPKPLRGEGGDATGRRSGVIGQIDPAIAEAHGVPAGEPLWAFELDADALGSAGAGDELRAASLPRFPSIVRDLSVLVDSGLPAAAVRGTIRSSAPSALVHVVEFDRYKGKGVPADRVSLSWRLTFRSPERTLTDAEVDAAMDRIVSALSDAHGAVRR